MKTTLLVTSILVMGLVAGLGAGWILFSGGTKAAASTDAGAPAKAKTLYTCGMHPWVRQDHPGDCPIWPRR